MEPVQQAWYTQFWWPFVWIIGVGALLLLCLLAAQLVILNKYRHLEAITVILGRYFENRDLFELRRFVYRHSVAIATLLPPSDQTTEQQTLTRTQIDDEIRRLSAGRWELEHLFWLINSLNHVSMLLRQRLVPTDLELELYRVITGMWRQLEPLVKFERKWRGDEGEFFAKQLELLAETMLRPGYQRKLARRGRRTASLWWRW